LAASSSNANHGIGVLWRAIDGHFLFIFGYEYSEIIVSTDSFPAGSFYFVAATYDSQTFQLFVNGVPEGSYKESKTIPYNSNPWTIGSAQPVFFPLGYYRTWNGVIDEVQAYNRALSPSELQSIYSAGTAGECKDLTFSPKTLKFPRRTVGTTSPPMAVTVHNVFPAPVAVRRVTTSGDFAETNNCPVSPATLATGATCSISVTFTPTATGTRTGKVTVANNAPAGPQTVSLSGAATDVSLSVSRLAFGSHKLGSTTGTKSVTVTNVGSVVVNFTGSGITTAGADPGDFLISGNTCGSSLGAGLSCTVSVQFQPLATGARTATLQFNDDGGSSPQTVSLSGTGT
jgi:hypothetical protein